MSLNCRSPTSLDGETGFPRHKGAPYLPTRRKGEVLTVHPGQDPGFKFCPVYGLAGGPRVCRSFCRYRPEKWHGREMGCRRTPHKTHPRGSTAQDPRGERRRQPQARAPRRSLREEGRVAAATGVQTPSTAASHRGRRVLGPGHLDGRGSAAIGAGRGGPSGDRVSGGMTESGG